MKKLAALTHVCMWSKDGWRPITAQDAARLHPYGTVHARSGLFMCELCGQYVLLTDEGINTRHFRHSSAEKSKDCPERTQGAGAYLDYKSSEHDLPIRLTIQSHDRISLELGFIKVPSNMYNHNLKIMIQSFKYKVENPSDEIIYLGERIIPDCITYLNIGAIPYYKYQIRIINGNDELHKYWPRVISGIDPEGTVFEKKSGRKLAEDSDVIVGNAYYILKKIGTIYFRTQSVRINEVCSFYNGWDHWRCYEVEACTFDEYAARFFLDYHCRLTEYPVKLQPVWPVFSQDTFSFRHGYNQTTLFMQGNGKVHVFPGAGFRNYVCANDNYNVVDINCNDRQQLISVGRNRALQYTYFWKETLSETSELPAVIVTDKKGKEITCGGNNTLPEMGIITVSLQFDGFVIKTRNNTILDKRKIQANTKTDIDGIDWKTQVFIYIGLDTVWSADFIKEEKNVNVDEEKILCILRNEQGNKIIIPHSLGNIADKLDNYPKIRNWVYKSIRQGFMYEKAYKKLLAFKTDLDKVN